MAQKKGHRSVWMWQSLVISPSSPFLPTIPPLFFFNHPLSTFIQSRFISDTFMFCWEYPVVARLLFLTRSWQEAGDKFPHRANCVKWNELARRRVPRVKPEPTGIHVEQSHSPGGPSSQSMLCNPSVNYLGRCIERAAERLQPALFLFLWTTLLFFFTPSFCPFWNSSDCLSSNDDYWFIKSSSHDFIWHMDYMCLFKYIVQMAFFLCGDQMCIMHVSENEIDFLLLLIIPLYFGHEHAHFCSLKVCRNYTVCAMKNIAAAVIFIQLMYDWTEQLQGSWLKMHLYVMASCLSMKRIQMAFCESNSVLLMAVYSNTSIWWSQCTQWSPRGTSITFNTFLVIFPKELGMMRRIGLVEWLEVLRRFW